MIGISKLLIDKREPSDSLRYGKGGHPGRTPSADNRPIVVYNCVKRCNLKCLHCYADSPGSAEPDVLSTAEALAMIDSCADFGCPVMLFSGGEPLLRGDLLELMRHSGERGMRTTLSTNGTLITRDVARELKAYNMGYVGVSLDGLEETHDRFRQVGGSWRRALDGLENCRAEGLRTGLRVTLTRHNFHEVPALFDLFEGLAVPRICFYHLVYTGAGAEIAGDDLSHEETREVMDVIIERTLDLHERGQDREILTVDNHADGPYLWLWALRNRPALAGRIEKMLAANRAKSTGQGISCVSWDGSVLPDQFWRNKVLGNVRERSFEEIWTDGKNAFLADLRRRETLVKGRCATCRFLQLCRGGFRARAEARFDNLWAEDPACYLRDDEISGETLRACQAEGTPGT
jgi:Fe-coproporphyrin III synthase